MVNDAEADWWNKLGISCWPTLLVLGPEAKPIRKDFHVLYLVFGHPDLKVSCSEISRMFVGEGHGARLMEFISFAIRHFKSSLSKGDRLPVPITSQLGLQVKTSLLSYPGKVCASEKSLFVSDTGNGRVVMVDIDSGVVSQIFNGFKTPQVRVCCT